MPKIMSKEECKKTAVRYAKAFIADEDEFVRIFHAERERYTANQSIVILNLCEVYRMFLCGEISNADGEKRTIDIFTSVKSQG